MVRSFEAAFEAAFPGAGDEVGAEPFAGLVGFALSPAAYSALSPLLSISGSGSSVSRKVVAARLSWAASSYPAECTSLDGAWRCLAARLAEPRAAEKERLARLARNVLRVKAVVALAGAPRPGQPAAGGGGAGRRAAAPALLPLPSLLRALSFPRRSLRRTPSAQRRPQP